MSARPLELNPDGTVSYWSAFFGEWIPQSAALYPSDYATLSPEDRVRVATHLRANVVGQPCVIAWRTTENVRRRADGLDDTVRLRVPILVYQTEDGQAHARLIVFNEFEPLQETHHPSLADLMHSYRLSYDDMVEIDP